MRDYKKNRPVCQWHNDQLNGQATSG